MLSCSIDVYFITIPTIPKLMDGIKASLMNRLENVNLKNRDNSKNTHMLELHYFKAKVPFVLSLRYILHSKLRLSCT